MKKNYSKPAIKVVVLRTWTSLLALSDVNVYSNTETYDSDVQYSRYGNSLWDDDGFDEDDY